jgi:hypothetical protein
MAAVSLSDLGESNFFAIVNVECAQITALGENNSMEQYMKEVERQFSRLVLPLLVPLYASNGRDPSNPDQIGTGFLLEQNSRPMLITAKHTLFGHDGKEEAGEKAFRHNEDWIYVGDVDSDVFSANGRDIACFYADELADRPSLNSYNIQTAPASLITIGGYLARDFKRGDGILRPKPFTFTGVSEGVLNGLIGLQYQRSSVKSTTNEMRQTAPIPQGLSGGPMLDAAKLAFGQVGLVGVFTEQDSGTARGEPSTYLQQILANS